MTLIELNGITVHLQRKPIKNLYIRVLPPDGRVRVSVPGSMDSSSIQKALLKHFPWIIKQQAIIARQPKPPVEEMTTGEPHLFWGKNYPLHIVERAGKHETLLEHDKLCLYVRPGTTRENRKKALIAFYRRSLKTEIRKRIAFWQGEMNVSVADWRVKKMKTLWGSCNIRARRIWINLELAKKPLPCLDYILVHELAHLLERKHNDRFKAYMDKFLPDWRERKKILNKRSVL